MPEKVQGEEKPCATEPVKAVSLVRLLAFLCLFIAVITINSGLMYQVVNPAFEHHQWLVSWYWAVPYIAALYIMRNLPRKTSRAYILIVAIAMIGLSFISFMIFDRSAVSYLIIDTLMMGACGVCDLFWWSILGEMLDFGDNPSKIFGIGLSSNVLGVLLGQLTERESQITALLLKGRTYKMIAGELYLSENTVKTHIKNIYSKLNINSKMELVNLLMDKEQSPSKQPDSFKIRF